jgi:hypothetical protein
MSAPQHCPRFVRMSLVLAAALLATGAPPAWGAPGDVKLTLDSPCKYPTGLATDGTRLFVADWRSAKIHQVSAAEGTVQKSFDAPTLRPHGLAWGDGKLFVSDDHSGWVYALNLETGLVESSFEAPGPNPTGLAYAGDGLFLLEKKSHEIYKVLPKDGTILNYFAAPTDSCTCLTYDGKYLWVSDRVKNEIYMVMPNSGMVINILPAPGPYAAGLAWLDGYLWNADFETRKLYQIIIQDQQKSLLTQPRRERVEYFWCLYNHGPGEIRDLTLSLAVPVELPNQKLLSEPSFLQSQQPPRAEMKVSKDRWGQECDVFELGTLPAGQNVSVSCARNVELSAIRYLIQPDEAGTLADIPAEIHKAYTVDGTRYRMSTPFIQETARKIVGDEKNPYWIARKVFNYLIDHLEYEMVGGWDVPEAVLKRGKGSCSEYTFAFIALCRAAGLPARYQGSIAVRGDDASIDEAFHRWAQVYLPNYGWVPVDPSGGDVKSPADQARAFGGLANRYLITTQGGGDSEYLEWQYNGFTKYSATGKCKVEEETYGFWEPLAEEKGATSAETGAATQCRPEK